MLKTGLSTCGKEIGEKLFADYAEAGIEMMELTMKKAAYDVFDFKAFKKLSDEYGVKLWSMHLPFAPFREIDISSPDLCTATVDYLCTLIKKGADIGIDKFVIHPSGEPIADENRNERMKISQQSLFELSNAAGECGAVIAVEDLPRSCLGNCSDDIIKLISVSDKLKVCFDTNHLLKENNVDFVNKVGDKIITLHVSDYDFVDEKHWLPGEGKIEWSELIRALLSAGYSGPWLYEIGFKTPDTIKRERDLNVYDFVKTTNALFSEI